MGKKWVKSFVVVGVLIKKGNKYLLVQEKSKKIYGLWNLPAGHIDRGESIEDAAIREAREETGYKIKLIKKIAIFQRKITESVKHVFKAKIIGGKLQYPEDEILDVKWFTYPEIKKMKNKFRTYWVLEGIGILEKKK